MKGYFFPGNMRINILLLFIVVALIFACRSPEVSNSDDTQAEASRLFKESQKIYFTGDSITVSEKKLCDSLSFDLEIVQILKKHCQTKIELLPKINDVGEATNSYERSICLVAPYKKNQSFVLANKETFRKMGYLVFLFNNDSTLKDCVGLMKGKDEIDIVKWRKSDGINYGHENKDVVSKLEEWQRAQDFYVLDVGQDYVTIQFANKIKDIPKFAREAYEFCPDIIDQGAGDMTNLIKILESENGVVFWWD
jgi:hypothetical protein